MLLHSSNQHMNVNMSRELQSYFCKVQILFSIIQSFQYGVYARTDSAVFCGVVARRACTKSRVTSQPPRRTGTDSSVVSSPVSCQFIVCDVFCFVKHYNLMLTLSSWQASNNCFMRNKVQPGHNLNISAKKGSFSIGETGQFTFRILSEIKRKQLY